jgi:maltooligosyltrehalose trehalohydrolase
MRVWAPRAQQVTLVADGERIPMQQAGQWWQAEATPQRYGFEIDGDLLPDPRSRWQPDGVHGLSAAFDEPFSWSPWAGRALEGGVIYELHVGTFTPDGTLDSAIERLDYLADLGVDFVELLPVNAFNGEHNWGYDGVLWFAVQHSYGGPAAYRRFVDACHTRGLAVIQDVVYNHLGPSGNYLPRFGPYLREGSANTWGDSVNLDEPEVRAYILDNAEMWLRDYRVDGLRLDAVHALVDTSETHILQQLAERTDALADELGRPLTLIAESDLNDPKLITPRPEGYGLTAQWSDDYHHALHVALTGETTGYYGDFASLAALAKTTERGFFHDGSYSSFRGHLHGHPIDPALPGWKLVTFAQDHDQIGNRATGDRLSATLDDGLLAVAAVLTLIGPNTPMLFMGEEWGASTPWQFFTSHPEPELGEAVAQGRIREFERMGWDPAVVPNPQDPATFTRSKLDWSELQQQRHARLHKLYRELIALRRDRPELRDPRWAGVRAQYDDETRSFRVDLGPLSVIANLGERPIVAEGTVIAQTAAQSGRADDVLPPHSAVIIERAQPPA